MSVVFALARASAWIGARASQQRKVPPKWDFKNAFLRQRVRMDLRLPPSQVSWMGIRMVKRE
jgi:hypothetical protein